MHELVVKLPIEIQRFILSYTYSPQKRELLCDIKSYVETKLLMKNKHEILSILMPSTEINVLFVNLLFSYLTTRLNNYSFYNERVVKIVSRSNSYNKHVRLTKEKNIEKFITYLLLFKEKYKNVILGLMLPIEREEYIKIIKDL